MLQTVTVNYYCVCVHVCVYYLTFALLAAEMCCAMACENGFLARLCSINSVLSAPFLQCMYVRVRGYVCMCVCVCMYVWLVKMGLARL